MEQNLRDGQLGGGGGVNWGGATPPPWLRACMAITKSLRIGSFLKFDPGSQVKLEATYAQAHILFSIWSLFIPSVRYDTFMFLPFQSIYLYIVVHIVWDNFSLLSSVVKVTMMLPQIIGYTGGD